MFFRKKNKRVEINPNLIEIKKINTPYFFNWGVFFKEQDGYGNRAIVANAIAKFWNTPSETKLDIPGQCMLGGYLYGHELYEDGEEKIFASPVQTIERVCAENHGEINEIGLLHDLMVATNKAGEKFYFYSDEFCEPTGLMIGDILEKRGLNQYRWYYLDPKYKGAKQLL